MQLRYLIIGGSGFVGTRLYSFLGQSQAVATFRDRPVAGGVPFDATRERLSESVLKHHRELTHAFIYHVCCPRPVSRLGLLQLLVDEIRCFRDLDTRVVPCSIRDFNFPEPRPLDTSMSPAKLYATLGEDFDDLSLVCRVAVARRYGMPAHA